ncbi:hypothetical protein A3C59_04715 [Candidatus Daviesbacteria bacterium RIFCSPHIGHO2_02_FULL_36_13]|uniref:Glycosyltransferase RgtA/B/C/D-like domain-containing protein n=1 Tax=Candidatus Daviesbacteria bacterium RIFCSPHIGHO2_02_FULL_36_13 TaxID=1797768 RepID=A0A1F5JNK7_9BACT|nr:MAG: hypothetical protein A3C59_04715 [Candidatus Daviesbacteria bacterium RIFCSPHIGHO2_02_FULL_36_13]
MILFVLFLAFVLRFINLDQSLWFDEAINVVYAKSNDFWWFVTKYPIGDFHPPLYFAVIWLWGHIFSFGEFVIRIPSVLFGIATIFLTYLIGRKLFSKNIGLIAALFLSLAPLHIYYSQEARMYSLAAFSAAFSSYFLLKLLEKEKFALFGYSFSVALVLYSDYLSYLILPAHLLFVFIYYKSIFNKYLLSLFLGVCSIIPWLFVFPGQLKSGIEKSAMIGGWREVVGGLGVKEVLLLPVKILIGRITFENKLIYAILLFLISLPHIIGFKKILSFLSEKVNYLLLWLFIPVISALILSLFMPVFSYFRLLFILPAFYILLAFALDKYKHKIKLILITLIIFFEIITSGVYLLNSQFHREDWRSAVSLINNRSNIQTLVLHKNSEIPAPFKYYQLNSIQSIAVFKKIPVHSSSDFVNLEETLMQFNKIFIFNYLVDITDPNRVLEKEIERLGFKKIKDYDFRGVGFIYEFEK